MSDKMFLDYNFKDYINEGLENIGFIQPSDIQEEVIERILNGENIIGKSQTGTGKTHAFLLPLLQKLDEKLNEVQVVIISPTRELAFQLYENVIKLTSYSKDKIDVRMYVGGSNRESEQARLQSSQPQIVIGTIGKLTDLAITTNVLKIHTAKYVVIDEADMVFEFSEIKDIDKLFARFQDIQVMSFSATISNEIINFINKYFEKHVLIDLVGKNIQKSSIDHYFLPTKNKNKEELLLSILKSIQPYLALIFANTVTKVDELYSFLSNNGLKVGKITGSLAPRERKSMLQRIKNGDFQYVVASDIAARGMDIVGVSHVINFELPKDIEYYIHRIGRTARFDSTGLAISFYDYDDEVYVNNLREKGIHSKFMAFKNNEFVITKERNGYTKKASSIESEIHQKHPVPKKVKPGYKKKRKELIDKEIRKLKRSKIEQIYRKKAKEKRNNND